MKKMLIALAVIATLAITSCKDATKAQYNSLGKRHKITLYGATGTVINSWISTGNVSNSANSDGWYFEDEKTGKLVEVAGTLVIEVL